MEKASDYQSEERRTYINNLRMELKPGKIITQIQRQLLARNTKTADIGEIETVQKKINELKIQFFEKVNKMARPLAQLTTRRREHTKSSEKNKELLHHQNLGYYKGKI